MDEKKLKPLRTSGFKLTITCTETNQSKTFYMMECDCYFCDRTTYFPLGVCAEHLNSELGLEIKTSTIHKSGLGLFATRTFLKDEEIIKYFGEELSTEAAVHRYSLCKHPSPDTESVVMGPYTYQKSKKSYIDALLQRWPGAFINRPPRNKKANVTFSQAFNSKGVYPKIKAKQTIYEGEELSIPYRFSSKYFSYYNISIEKPLTSYTQLITFPNGRQDRYLLSSKVCEQKGCGRSSFYPYGACTNHVSNCYGVSILGTNESTKLVTTRTLTLADQLPFYGSPLSESRKVRYYSKTGYGPFCIFVSSTEVRDMVHKRGIASFISETTDKSKVNMERIVSVDEQHFPLYARPIRTICNGETLYLPPRGRELDLLEKFTMSLIVE